MIHILSQDGLLLINAEKVVAYMIRARAATDYERKFGHANGYYVYEIAAKMPDADFRIGTFKAEETARHVLGVLGEEIAKLYWKSRMFSIPTEEDYDKWRLNANRKSNFGWEAANVQKP